MVDPLSYFSFTPGLHDWCNISFLCVFADEVRSVVAAGGGVRRQLRSGSRLVP